jgi:hypothetical protein
MDKPVSSAMDPAFKSDKKAKGYPTPQVVSSKK